MVYTVKQLADLAGVSVRTLHYYDEIELLKPSFVGENNYRYYADEALYRLQHILFYKELDVGLDAIRAILDDPAFDVQAALHEHRRALRARVRRLSSLIDTIDHTLLHLKGEVPMSNDELFAGFTPEEEERYTQQAREQYGAEEVDASYKLWKSYTPQKQQAIMREGQAIYTDMVAAMPHGPLSDEVQQIVARWHEHLRYFYEPFVERLEGLGQLYVDSPDFANKFRQMHPELPEFMQQAINHYCARLRGEG